MIFIVGLSKSGKTTYANKLKMDSRYKNCKIIHSDNIKIDIMYNKINTPGALDKAIQKSLIEVVKKYEQYKNTTIIIEGVDIELLPMKILSKHEILVVKPSLEDYLNRFDKRFTSLEYIKNKYLNYYSFIDKIIRKSKLNIKYV